MITCSYCEKELTEDIFIQTDRGPACSDCALLPAEEHNTMQEEQQSDPETSQQNTQESETQESPFNLVKAFQELQFIRLKQCAEGETDDVIMKRPLCEIILMMEREIEQAKKHVVNLHPEATLNARYHVLAAVTLGLAYISTHPGPN